MTLLNNGLPLIAILGIWDLSVPADAGGRRQGHGLWQVEGQTP